MQCIGKDFDQLLCDVAASPRSALMLDYDGTLAPFCQSRHRAYPYPGVSSLIKEIMDSERTRVIIITGRRAADIISLLGLLPHPEIWGSYGMERLRPTGSYESPRISWEVKEGLKEAGKWLAKRDLRHVAERKPGSLAVHWRGLAQAAANQIREQVLEGWQPIAERCHMALVEFDGGLEIRIHGYNKASALCIILKEIGPEVPIACLGDDSTDEQAFRCLGDRGLSVLVRPEWRDTAASAWLKPPEELLSFLTLWLIACRADRQKRSARQTKDEHRQSAGEQDIAS